MHLEEYDVTDSVMLVKTTCECTQYCSNKESAVYRKFIYAYAYIQKRDALSIYIS